MINCFQALRSISTYAATQWAAVGDKIEDGIEDAVDVVVKPINKMAEPINTIFSGVKDLAGLAAKGLNETVNAAKGSNDTMLLKGLTTP
jgi:hypothetical protein